MSADEFARQIAGMTDHEIEVLEAALRRRREMQGTVLREETDAPAPASSPGRKMSSVEAMDYVFDNFDGLLRRLAQ